MTRPDRVLDYRQLTTRHGTAVLAALMRRERAWHTVALLKFWLGLPLSVLGPALLVGTIMGIVYWWFGPTDPYAMGVYVLGVALVVALTYWTEWRYRGRYFEEHARDFAGGASSHSEFEYNYFAGRWVITVEVLLLAPRLVMEGVQETRRAAALKRVDHVLAAKVLARLLGQADGMPVVALVAPDEPPAALTGVLAYLAYYDWIGVAKARDRAWASSDARKALG